METSDDIHLHNDISWNHVRKRFSATATMKIDRTSRSLDETALLLDTALYSLRRLSDAEHKALLAMAPAYAEHLLQCADEEDQACYHLFIFISPDR